MWNGTEFYYPEMDTRYRPVHPIHPWVRRSPRFAIPYARPQEMSMFGKQEMNLVGTGMGIPPFRPPKFPFNLVTPHAGPKHPPPVRLRRPPPIQLYRDFSDPPRPTPIAINVQTSALKCRIEWKQPALTDSTKYTYKLEVWEGIRCDTYDFPANVLAYDLKTTPGGLYKLEITARDYNSAVVAMGTACIKAAFSGDEMQTLYRKSLDFVGSAMHAFHFLYRCKPKVYYDDIQYHRGGIMEKYLKDNNGQAASSINGAISGLFFSARLLPDGNLPSHSPFGNVRMLVPALRLLDPNRVNMYFCDFYCNYITHYVTVVICEKQSDTDIFCMQRLIKLAPESNPFLRICFRSPLYEPEFWVNKNVWVEIYYTENVPLSWGRFDTIIATGAGTSRVGGLPHNKQCQLCNLYPQKPSSAKLASAKLNSTFELVLRLERERLGNDRIENSDSTDLIETLCTIIDSVVEKDVQREVDTAGKVNNSLVDKKAMVSPFRLALNLKKTLKTDEMQPFAILFKKLVCDVDGKLSAARCSLRDLRRTSCGLFI